MIQKFIEERLLMNFSGEEVIEDLFLENGGAIFPIVRISFDERPAINITNVWFSIRPKQIESTYFLLKLLDDSIADEFFIRSK